ncbi:MAG: AgmX/PglI C-terminal domain-containing protein [Deltaproteobacteria bacterium]|nr:AgmX/PglI C-terminal domain-containing protein [Deltaproteobacteria bacterium]
MRARALLLLLLTGACGGAQTQPTTPAAAPPAQAPAAPVATTPTSRCGSTQGMSIEGQMGSLDPARVRRILRDAEPAMLACYTRRVEALPCLAGRVALRIRVGEDGAVRWAIPTESTLGDRATERCMVETAATLRFEPPCGGEAEVAYSLDLDGGPDRRPATDVAAQRVETALRTRRTALATCRHGDHTPLRVTLYVAPDGTIPAAGAALSSHEATGMTDCVLREVQALRLPTPGSWYARTTVTIP